MWTARLRDNYDNDHISWEHYSDMYGLAERLGFTSAKEAWEVNPLIQGPTVPEDFQRVVRLTIPVIEEQLEYTQNDLKQLLDGIDDSIVEQVCQLVKERFEILLAKST